MSPRVARPVSPGIPCTRYSVGRTLVTPHMKFWGEFGFVPILEAAHAMHSLLHMMEPSYEWQVKFYPQASYAPYSDGVFKRDSTGAKVSIMPWNFTKGGSWNGDVWLFTNHSGWKPQRLASPDEIAEAAIVLATRCLARGMRHEA